MALTEIERSSEVERFEQILGSVQRPGIDRLLDFIRKSDFYTAPASTKYHGSFEGGLLHHSLLVFDRLMTKFNSAESEEGSVWKKPFENMTSESIAVIALLHDICKTYFYVAGTRNQKTYDPEKVKAAAYGVKHDSMGDFIWETVPSYDVKDQLPYGHGEKSVMMIEEYIKLTLVERFAIRWHMGFTEPKESWNTLREAMTKFPVILAVSEADLEATIIMEAEEE